MADEIECPVCDGTGTLIKDYRDTYQGRIKIDTLCPQCWGHGRLHPSLILPKNRKLIK